jgi:hypothetical protein
VDIPEVADTPLQDKLVLDACGRGIEADREVLGINEVYADSAFLGGGNDGFLFPSNGVV